MPAALPCFVDPGKQNVVGERYSRLFIEECGLAPDARVLEVGCGSGRIALALASYLTRQYVGFDVHAEAVQWCQEHIQPLNPAFRFYWADVHNGFYQSAASCPASQYTFPHDDGAFDFVYATSVFTHILPADMERYFREITRVLAPGGVFLSTFFIINETARRNMQKGLCRHVFQDAGGYWTTQPGRPEKAIGYEEEYLDRLYAACGLSITSKWMDGWSKAQRGGQDHIIARR